MNKKVGRVDLFRLHKTFLQVKWIKLTSKQNVLIFFGCWRSAQKALTLDLGHRLAPSLFTTNRPLPCPTYVSSISSIPLTLSCVTDKGHWHQRPSCEKSRHNWKVNLAPTKLVIQNDGRLWGMGCTPQQPAYNSSWCRIDLIFILRTILLCKVVVLEKWYKVKGNLS